MSRRGGVGALRAAALAAAFAALASGCGERGNERAKGGTGALYHYRLAAEKYREGDFDAAIDIYERSLQMNPKLAEAHLDLGIINDDYRGAKDKAIEHYRAFLALEPRSAKAEMVRRWILKIEEGKSAAGEGGPAAPPPSAPEAGEAAPRVGQERLREDLAILRAENEAYLKTVEALRGELTQARDELADLRSAAPAGTERDTVSTASGWEAEKREIWQRYRKEKEGYERGLEALREEIAHLQAQRASSDDALKKALLKIEEGAKAPPPVEGGAPGRELGEALEKLREAEQRSAAGARERQALLSRLKDAERKLQGYRLQAPSDSPLLLSKVKADAERERQELKKAYEKRIADATAGFARERGEMQRELAEAHRAAAKGQAAGAVTPGAAQRTRADAEREKAELKEQYEQRIAEAQVTATREKADIQKELAEARREAEYLRAQAEKARTTAGQSEQYTAGAMERLREQFRREKAELEERFRKERETLLARVNAQGGSSRAGGAARPAVSPAAPTRPAPSSTTRRTTARGERRAATPRWSEPGARPTAAPMPVRRHRTVKGDTLRSIAQRFYGSPGRWKSVYDANLNTLRGQRPSASLPPGWILVIP